MVKDYALRESRTFLIPYPTPIARSAVNPPSMGHFGSKGSQLGSITCAKPEAGITRKTIVTIKKAKR